MFTQHKVWTSVSWLLLYMCMLETGVSLSMYIKCSTLRTAGNARVKDCLEQNRQEDDFSSECRDELESMMAERATDVRLDSNLRSACEEDIMRTCGWEEVGDQHAFMPGCSETLLMVQ